MKRKLNNLQKKIEVSRKKFDRAFDRLQKAEGELEPLLKIRDELRDKVALDFAKLVVEFLEKYELGLTCKGGTLTLEFEDDIRPLRPNWSEDTLTDLKNFISQLENQED